MLTSVKNPWIKELRKLKQSKYRQRQGVILLEGGNLLGAAAMFDVPLENLCATEKWIDRHGALWAQLQSRAQRWEVVSDEILEAIATTINPDGIVATAERQALPHLHHPPSPLNLGIALERIQDPGNLGTIIRTVAAAGGDGIWLSGDSVAPDNPKVLRASVGTWFQQPLMVVPDLSQAIAQYQRQGVRIIGTTAQAATPYWAMDWTKPTMVLLGNEGEGLSGALLDLVDESVAIPLAPGVESLNLAIATGVILFEARRQMTLG